MDKEIRCVIDTDAILGGRESLAVGQESPGLRIGMLNAAVFPVVQEGIARGNEENRPDEEAAKAEIERMVQKFGVNHPSTLKEAGKGTRFV